LSEFCKKELFIIPIAFAKSYRNNGAITRRNSNQHSLATCFVSTSESRRSGGGVGISASASSRISCEAAVNPRLPAVVLAFEDDEFKFAPAVGTPPLTSAPCGGSNVRAEEEIKVDVARAAVPVPDDGAAGFERLSSVSMNRPLLLLLLLLLL
jgi:hypothetical protein